MGADDAYAELGLAPGASELEVKAAWRRLASQWHPDRNASAAASERMQRINRALEAIRLAGLSDAAEGDGEAPEGDTAPETGGTAGAGPGDAGRTLGRKIKLTLEEAAGGCVKVVRGKLIVRCTACAGAGRIVLGGDCAGCQGAGTVRQRAWYGWYGEPSECPACRGDGIASRPCAPCSGSGRLPAQAYRVNVRIPHGVRDGDLLHAGARRQQPGQAAVHLDLRVELMPHPLFRLDGDGTVHCDVPVDGYAWIANRVVEVPTLRGLHRLALQRGQLSYRLAGLGFPVERRGPPGDQWVTIEPSFPEPPGTDQEILLDQLAASSTAAGAPPAPARLAEWRRAVARWDKSRARPPR